MEVYTSTYSRSCWWLCKGTLFYSNLRLIIDLIILFWKLCNITPELDHRTWDFTIPLYGSPRSPPLTFQLLVLFYVSVLSKLNREKYDVTRGVVKRFIKRVHYLWEYEKKSLNFLKFMNFTYLNKSEKNKHSRLRQAIGIIRIASLADYCYYFSCVQVVHCIHFQCGNSVT